MEAYLASPYHLTPPLSLIVQNCDGIEEPLVELTGRGRMQSWCFVTDTPAREAEMLATVRQRFGGLRPEQIGVKTFNSLRELRAYVVRLTKPTFRVAGVMLRYEAVPEGKERGIAMPWRHLVEQ